MKWFIAGIILLTVLLIVIFLRKRKSDVRKIYKTTDGYFTQDTKIKKPRRVAVVKQRKDDGALAVVKIYSKEGKDLSSNAYIKDLTLSPKDHKSLKEDSIVGNQVHVGTKSKDKEYKPIYSRDFEATKDKLTKKEHRQIEKTVQSENPKHRKTHEEKMKKWDKHFSKKQ